MRKVRATVDVVGSVADAEGLWYDLHRWPGFVEGLVAARFCRGRSSSNTERK